MITTKTRSVNGYFFHLGPICQYKKLLIACGKLAKLVKKFIY